MGYDACERASPIVTELGSVGAGTGATVGKALGATGAMKGGIGCVVVEGDGIRAAAIAAVNAFGDVRDATGQIIAGARDANGAFGDAARALAERLRGASRFADAANADAAPGAMQNTTLCVVAIDVPLGRVALSQLARAATAALYRRITPCGTTFDGDVVFAICPIPPGPLLEDIGLALRAEALVVQALEGAIESAVRHAVGRDGVPGLADG
jgi:L-aminopeptidase/D-esterase-like protein